MPRPALPTEPDRAAALNNAAIELLLLGPDDDERVLRISELLAAVAGRDGETDGVREALAAAVTLLDGTRTGAVEIDSAVSRVGSLIEMAMHGEPVPSDRGTEAGSRPHGALPADAAHELLPDFVAESLDYLEQAEGALLDLESDPVDIEALNTVLRAFHTIKSTAGFLGIEPISDLAHGAESLLCQVRDDGEPFTAHCAGLTLECTDMMRVLVDGAGSALDSVDVVLPPGYAELLERVGRAAQGTGTAPRGSSTDSAATTHVPEADAARPAAGGSRARARESDPEGWIRVRTGRLDELVDLIGELMVAQSMVAQHPAVRQDRHGSLERTVGQTSKLVRQLQDIGMSMRMVPLSKLFQRMERLARDLGRESGKGVELVTDGAETEIDRTMVDLLADPLGHMVRNAIGHGIETPAERAALGKAPVGTLRLAAFQEAGAVVIELHDDGRGLDTARILERARDKGLVPADGELTPTEVQQLIFEPGLSTASAVTELSGRGVGMDVVRSNIEALRGRIEIASSEGSGTTFTLRLPLTLAVTEGMLVRIGGDRYVLPTASMYMSVRPVAAALVRLEGGGELVMMHGEMLPIVRLHELFGITGAERDPACAVLVVVDHGERRCALLVDELLGQQQFVVKSAGKGLGRIDCVAGGTILGDGAVGLILDVPAVLERWSA
jgi:two-component system, chemotaxis family, sensor kinase CheA